VPYTNGRPLVIGPLFLGWPKESVPANDMGKPRFGVGIRGLLKPFAQRGWDRAVRKAALVICATESLSEKTRSQTDGVVLTSPVIVEPPPNLVSERGPKGTLKLLFAANLYRNKNPLVFCETIHRLQKMGVPVAGEILGDGPERAAMEQWCQSNALGDAVRFLGRIPNSDVYQHLADADGLISTSFGEPYGRGIAEAMSVGAVPICHRSGGPADFISSGVDGLLVDRVDATDYANAIAATWNDPAAWQRLSAAALDKAGQWKTGIVVDQLESALCALPRKSAFK
jgi:glycosyltransferase involved in cell wall biosynthesis